MVGLRTKLRVLLVHLAFCSWMILNSSVICSGVSRPDVWNILPPHPFPGSSHIAWRPGCAISIFPYLSLFEIFKVVPYFHCQLCDLFRQSGISFSEHVPDQLKVCCILDQHLIDVYLFLRQALDDLVPKSGTTAIFAYAQTALFGLDPEQFLLEEGTSEFDVGPFHFLFLCDLREQSKIVFVATKTHLEFLPRWVIVFSTSTMRSHP